MLKLKSLVGAGVVAIALIGMSGCISVQTPAAGWLFTDVKFGDTATTAPGATKTGKACATSVLGIVATGDASIEAAKAAGGITTVSYVDHHTNWIILFGTYCTIVRGT